MSNEPATSPTSPFFHAVRALGAVALLLILIAVLYASWAIIANWSVIGV